MRKHNYVSNRMRFAMVIGVTFILIAAEIIVTAVEAILTGLKVTQQIALNSPILLVIMWGVAGVIMGFILSFILGK